MQRACERKKIVVVRKKFFRRTKRVKVCLPNFGTKLSELEISQPMETTLSHSIDIGVLHFPCLYVLTLFPLYAVTSSMHSCNMYITVIELDQVTKQQICNIYKCL